MSALQQQVGAAGQVVQLFAYHEGSAVGGGTFLWMPDSTAEPDGGRVVAVAGRKQGRWHRQADDVRVTYFGARGDGVTDDTASIQSAIDAVSATSSPGVIFESDRRLGGTVVFPPGHYRISDTLLVGPNTTLRGVGSPSGFQRRVALENDEGSVIIARFEDAKKWMISTAVYKKQGEQAGELLAHREIMSGKAYDDGHYSRTNGIKIQDLLLIGEKNQNDEPPYGGIRLQACPGSVIERVGVFHVDVAFLLNSGWGLAMRDCFSQSYLYGILALYNVNGLSIDNCYINCRDSEDREVTEDSVLTGGDHRLFGARASGIPSNYAYQRTGILSHYAHNMVLNNVITEHWDIARHHRHGDLSDTGSWLEGNREREYVLQHVKMNLNTPKIASKKMLREDRFMLLGPNAQVTVSQSKPFPVEYTLKSAASRVAVQVPAPDYAGWPYNPAAVTYANAKDGVVRVAGNTDERVDNGSIADEVNYVDINTALERIANSDETEWKVILAPGAVCSLEKNVTLNGKEVRFIAEDSAVRPILRFMSGEGGTSGRVLVRSGGAIEFENIKVEMGADAQSSNSGEGIILVDGGHFRVRLAGSEVALRSSRDRGDGFSFIQRKGHAAIIDAVFTDSDLIDGFAIFSEDGDGGSVIRSQAVNTRASREMLHRGAKGWVGPRVEVNSSNMLTL